MQFLRTILHPDWYHGHGQQPPFFEGWYYKLISVDGSQRYAIIPGVFKGENGHAFVQVLDGVQRRSAYHRFPLESFWGSRQAFQIQIGPNEFDRERILVDLDGELGRIQGELRFSGVTPWPVSLLSPGIMGPFAWAPAMETYHGVVSLDHTIHGGLQIDGRPVDLEGGRGYSEKDWGQQFPEAWVWFQSNHFEQPGTSLTASIAIIPWRGSAFAGSIIGLWHAGRLFRFATYTGARTYRLQVEHEHVEWVLDDGWHRLELLVRKQQGGLLRGPDRVEMGKRVVETLDAEVQVRLRDRTGRTLFAGTGRYAGLEVNGDLARLARMVMK